MKRYTASKERASGRYWKKITICQFLSRKLVFDALWKYDGYWICFNYANDFCFMNMMMVMMMMMKKMVNWFCGMVDWRKAFSPISNWHHSQRSSPSRISEQDLNLHRTWMQALLNRRVRNRREISKCNRRILIPNKSVQERILWCIWR